MVVRKRILTVRKKRSILPLELVALSARLDHHDGPLDLHGNWELSAGRLKLPTEDPVLLDLYRQGPLLLARHDETREHGQNVSVHGHRNGDLVERDAVEKHLHVFDRIDGDAGLPDVTGHARVIGVVSTMGCEVECDR